MSAKPAKLAASAPIREVSVENPAAKSAPARDAGHPPRASAKSRAALRPYAAVSAQHAAVSPSSSAETARCALAARPSASRAPRRASLSPAHASGAKKNAGQPVRRVNRSRGRNGERVQLPPPESRTIRGIFWFFTESLGEQTKASAKHQKAARGRSMKARPTLRVRRRASKLLFPQDSVKKRFFCPQAADSPAKSLNPSEFFPKPS